MKVEKTTIKVGEKTYEHYYLVVGVQKIAIKPDVFKDKSGKWNMYNKRALDLLCLKDTSEGDNK